MNPTDAARHAKYAEGTEKQRGHENVTNSDLNQEISVRRAELSDKTEFTVQVYQQQLRDDRSFALLMRQPSAMVSASVAMGRSCGYDKSNEIGNQDTPLSLTPEQHEQALAASNRTISVKLSREGA